jgi:hypothetical protein
VVKTTAKNRDQGKEVIALLLNQRDSRTIVTPQLVQTLAKSFNTLTMKTLLTQRDNEVKVTTEIVKAAAENWDQGKKVMALLLDQCDNRIIITPQLV